MNLLELFRETLQDTVLKPFDSGEIVLGGPHTKHLSAHFKLGMPGSDTLAANAIWSEKAIVSLAQMVGMFPNDIQFYQLHDPLRDCPWDVTWDDEVVIRRYELPMAELWTEPAEGVEDFVSQKKWDAHIKVVYEVVFMFER